MATPAVLNRPPNRRYPAVCPDYPTAYMPFNNNLAVCFNNVQATFSRNSIAYKQDGTAVLTGQPRFETGSQGDALGAVMVEEGTTNLVPNPLAEDNLIGIAGGFYGTSAGAVERSTVLPSGCLWATGVKTTVTVAGDVNLIFKQTDGSEATTGIPVTAGATYTYSIWLYIPSDSNITALRLRPIEWNSSGNAVKDNSLTVFATKGVWQRVIATWTLQSTTAKVTLRVFANGTGEFYATACMLEQKPYATSFINGTRSPEILTIPTAGVLNPQEGTVEFWVKRTNLNTAEQQFIDQRSTHKGINIRLNGNAIVFVTGNGTAEHYTNSGSLSWTTDDWYYIAVTWSVPGQFKRIYRNGIKVAETTSWTAGLYLGTSNIHIGKVAWGTSYYLNAYFDDLRISNRARTDEEIAAAYYNRAIF